MRRRSCLPLAAVATIALTAPAAGAHGLDVDVVARGLDNPRHVAVAKDGDVYVAESGRGGYHATARSCFDSAEGFACTGATGAVTKIGRWGQRRVVTGLASFAPVTGDSAIGPHGVYVDGHDVYVTNGGPTGPTVRPAGRSSCATRRSSPRTRSPRSTAGCSGSSRTTASCRSPTRGPSSAASTPTRPSPSRSSTATRSTCSSTTAATSSPTRAATPLVRSGHRGRLEALTGFPSIPRLAHWGDAGRPDLAW